MEILGELRIIAKHFRKHPLCNLFVACEDPSSCNHCRKIPSEKLLFSRFIWSAWGGKIPNMVMAADSSHYLSFLEHCRRTGNRGDDPLPPELAVSWRKCALCSCFYYRSASDLQRHFHLVHFGREITLSQLDSFPFGCSHRLERANDQNGVPYGPYKYCGRRFESAIEFKKHKEEKGHKRPTKEKSVQQTQPLLPAPLMQESRIQSIQKAPTVEKVTNSKRNRAKSSDYSEEAPVQRKTQRRGLSPNDAAIELLRGERDQLIKFGNIKRARKSIEGVFYSSVRSDTTIKQWKKKLNSKENSDVQNPTNNKLTIDRLAALFDEIIRYIEGDSDDEEE